MAKRPSKKAVREAAEERRRNPPACLGCGQPLPFAGVGCEVCEVKQLADPPAAPALKRNAPWSECVTIGPATLYLGDCTEVMAALDDGSMHACVTDPPYELGFMGKAWDKAGGVASDPATWEHVLRLLTPGGHCVAFAGSRTYHRIAMAIERSGFDIRDQLMWLYGSGFPKSLDVSKAIDASDAKSETPEDVLRFTSWMRSTGITARQIADATGTHMASHYLTAGSQPAVATADHFDAMRPYLPAVPQWVERLVADRTVRARAKSENLARREVVGEHDKSAQAARWRESFGQGEAPPPGLITTAYTSEAKRWEGWGTALKPAHEPIALARKPFRGTVAGCVMAHGTGAMNIRDSLIGDEGGMRAIGKGKASAGVYGNGLNSTPAEPTGLGRWPANVITDGSLDVLEAFPSSAREAIRFFYAAKASKDEREFGMEGVSVVADGGMSGRNDGSLGSVTKRANFHPTVKPINLMAWLCRLITPPGGQVLEPFMGSGSTGIAAVRHGFRFVGIERDPQYFEIARRRIAAAVEEEARMPTLERQITAVVRAMQLDMLNDTVGGQVVVRQPKGRQK